MAAEAAVLWKQGWHLSAEGIAALKQENNITTIDGIVRKALDEDLRSIGEKFLPEDISRGGSSELIGPCVLQVTKVRNVSAPKANEESGHAPRMLKVQMTDGHTTCIGLEVAQVQQLRWVSYIVVLYERYITRNVKSGHAPRMLKVQMTDGHTTCIGLEVAQVQQLRWVAQVQQLRWVGFIVVLYERYITWNVKSGHAPRMLKVQMTDGHTTCIGLEVAQVQQLSLSTPPGTKVKLTGSIAISNGFLMLEGSNVKVLGGQVEKLFSRWDIQRKLAHHSRANVKVEGGAPPFVPFGQRVSGGAVATKDLRNKKSLPKKETGSEEADEFSEQRKAVIAEVSKSKEGTKTFGGTGSLPATAVNPEKKWGGPADRRGENRPQGVYRELSNESSQVEEKSVQKLVEMGFSRQDSVASLRQNSGDVQEAINTLVTRQGQGQGQGRDRPDRGHRGQREDRGRGRGRGRRGRGEDEEEDVSTRPSGPATLFDFILESKIDNLKIDDSKPGPGAQTSQPPRYNKPQGGRENHYDGQGWPQVGDSQFYGQRNNSDFRVGVKGEHYLIRNQFL
ncbi:tudor domain-containing protein 3-like [Branchiostoma floridae x Branchiostoma japonicum]